ncbi:MAG: hypothetical protein M3340_20640 [Actinomycetota bacterium]|nr:hypothetical protein [Actinomycetota bacterium]
MRGRGVCIALGLAAGLAVAAPASAAEVSGPHQTVDQRYTTTKPATPTGFTYDATYHAAGDPSARPPYMDRMISHPPPGLRYDTSVPERCTASDLQLAAFGAAACPEGSRLGGGTTRTAFMGGSETTVDLDLFNNENEQIILARSPLITTIARGRIHPDMSVEFASPTCYPSVPGVTCPVDNVLQLSSSMRVPAYTRTIDGVVRSWMTTPPKCPKSARWRSTIQWWWADGTEDTLTFEHPCKRPRAKRSRRR